MMTRIFRQLSHRRAFFALLLCAVCAFGLFLTPARAASWMTPYLEQATEWGIMVGDAAGNLNENRQITRAEFVTMINRAFGHTVAGATPFQDVPASAWYAEDIGIAYRAGYFSGTSPTTASPNSPVTREQAVTMLGRNLRLQGRPGALTNYSDSREIANWSRGMVQEATDMGIVTGYDDGSFRPRTPITRGQAACILVQSLGTLIQETGAHSVGGIYGNLTITAPGVTLKDTVVTGNLYLSGGLGLEDVTLENVKVLGKIVVCGSGVSHKGEASVTLRNVTASGLEIDSMTDQFLSLRTEGLTNIGNVTVRTSSYLEDMTGDGLGLQTISLEGSGGQQFQLSGNIKEVINRTPSSFLSFGQAVADKVTVDEQAVGSILNIDGSATLRELNLDTGTTVTGAGDIRDLTVNSDGSVVSMLPDTITVRPGVIAGIGGSNMDSAAAAEASEDPRLLAGYPAARNVGPKAADIVFSTNKGGTLYWALTALADGSVGEEELLSPASYSSKILKSGTLKVPSSRTELTAKLSGLTTDGSYYVSAILQDARGRRSPVKVTAFTTPDDSIPNFSTGYPYTAMTSDGDQQIIQAMVMPTKDCQLYYALLPKGSTAPKPADFKAAAVTGNLGYGVVELNKNTQRLIPKVNSSYLAEQVSYDLYLWLNDADNGKSSAVKKLTVTTLDKTPPVIQHLTVTDVAAKSVSLTYSLDEPGTLYWAVVKRGTQFYAMGVNDPEDLVAKIQVESGTGALKKGSSTASKMSSDVKFNITGLEPQTAYDVYYVAKDKAGNYSVYTTELTPPMEINTLDNEPPTVSQEFTHDGTDNPQNPTPYPDTSIRLVFSEQVQGIRDVGGQQVSDPFLELYSAVASAKTPEDKSRAEDALAEALRAHITLYYKPISGTPEPVAERTGSEDDWVIDYRKATISLDPSGSGEMILTFPSAPNLSQSGLNLLSGATYYFELEGIADTSTAANRMAGVRGVTKLPEFTTIDAQLVFSRGSSTGSLEDGTKLTFDMNFRLSPVTVSNVSNEIVWDMLFWSDNSMTIELYCREVGDDAWKQVGDSEMAFNPTTQIPTVGVSISRELLSTDAEKANPNFQRLRDLGKEREYGIVVKSLNGVPDSDRDSWSGTVSIRIVPVAGDQGSMAVLANTNLTPANYVDHQRGIYKVKEIGLPTEYTVSNPFRDKNPPTFIDGYPTFTAGDANANMNIQLSRDNASYYYVVTAVGNIPTTLNDGTVITAETWNQLPEDGTMFDGVDGGNVSRPTSNSITNPPYSGDKYVIGSGKYRGGVQTISVSGLEASTQYVAYFVLQGESQESISEVYAFRFKTEEVVRPVLRVSLNNPSATVTSTGANPKEADVKYMMLVAGQEGAMLNQKMSTCWDDTAADKAGLSTANIKNYKKMTLLEAMETSYTKGSQSLGSVFDLFANGAKQAEVSAWFNSASSNGTSIMLTGNMSLTIRNNLTSTVNCQSAMSKNNPNMEYWFVAMGQSPLGSGYAFSAARYLFYPDNTPPQVITLSTEVRSSITNNYADAVNKTYTGKVTITFSTDLYFKENSTTYKQVVDRPVGELVGTDYVSTSVLLSSSNVSVDHQVKDNTNPPCRTLILDFTTVKSGNQISLSQNLSNSRGITGNLPLTLTMTLVKNSEGYYIPQYNLTSSGWGSPVVN